MNITTTIAWVAFGISHITCVALIIYANLANKA